MKYCIGDFNLIYDDCYKLKNDIFMEQFRIDELNKQKATISYKTIYFDLDIFKDFMQLSHTTVSEIIETEKGKLIIIHWATCRYAIGYWINDLDKEEIPIYINPKIKEEIPMSANRFFSLIGLHHILLMKRTPVLHASYIEWHNKAILFAAPSGTGKSTQSNLWKDYENANIINEDRVLISKRSNKWYAFGYPSCGSSRVCQNKTLPLRLIVILEQGEINKIVPLKQSEKFKAIFTGIEVFPWNLNEINMSFECANSIIEDVEIVKLVCTPNNDAVSILKNYLLGGKYDE